MELTGAGMGSLCKKRAKRAVYYTRYAFILFTQYYSIIPLNHGADVDL